MKRNLQKYWQAQKIEKNRREGKKEARKVEWKGKEEGTERTTMGHEAGRNSKKEWRKGETRKNGWKTSEVKSHKYV